MNNKKNVYSWAADCKHFLSSNRMSIKPRKMKVAPSVSDQFGPTCRPEDYKRPLLHSLLGRHSRRRQMSRLSVSPPSPAPKAPRPHLAFSGSSAWRAPRLNPFSHSSSRPWPPLACCNPQQKPPPHHHCHCQNWKFTTAFHWIVMPRAWSWSQSQI